MPASNNAGKTRGRPFAPGNKMGRGRPKGSRNKATLAVQELLDGEAENLARKAIERALEGDLVALRLCLERILPPARDQPIRFTFTAPESAEQIPAAIGRVIKAASNEKLTLSQAQTIVSLLDRQRQAFETSELAQRIDEIERLLEERKQSDRMQ